MEYIMNADTFIEKLKFAESKKTVYIKGCFGAPMTPANKVRYTKNLQYNANRAAIINSCSDDTFGFDCVCLIKGILWGWNADKSKNYGGAKYTSNGVSDFGADSAMNFCTDVSTDFSNIVPGEVVWMPGHVGVYVGDGTVIECTPKWTNNVQYSNLGNIGLKTGHWRNWNKHGKLKYIDYSAKSESPKDTQEYVPSTTPKRVGKVTASTLNVRQGPGTGYPLYDAWSTLSKGNLVDVCDEKDGWLYIRIVKGFGDNHCQTMHFAWVSAKYIQ